MPSDEILQKWKNLRDTYMKCIKQNKTSTGQEFKPLTKWQWASQMEFLRPFVSLNSTCSNIMPLNEDAEVHCCQEIETESQQPGTLETYEVCVDESTNTVPIKIDVPSRKRLRKDSYVSTMESLVNYFEKRHKKPQQTALIFCFLPMPRH